MCLCSDVDSILTPGSAARSHLSAMTYQHHVSIKQESPSPTGNALQFSGDATSLLVGGSNTPSSPTGEARAGPVTRRFKSESEGPAPNPETKNRLKRIVLGRRKARGVTEVLGNLFEKPKPNQLTPADLEKRAKRKKQNREAAKRCREKKKTHQNITAQEHGNIIKENAQLQQSICIYIQKLAILKRSLTEHLSCGDCRLASAIREKHMDQLNQITCQMLSGNTTHLKSDQDLASAPSPMDCCDLEDPRLNYQPASVGSCYDTPISVSSSDSTDYAPSSSSGCVVENLHSWDLQNINPDIPADQVSANLLEEMMKQPRAKLVEGEWQHVKPSRERPGCVNTRSASESGSVLCESLTFACVGEEDHIPRSSLAYTTRETLPTWNVTTDQLYQCIPRDLIQPSSTIFQAAPYSVHSSRQMTKTTNYDQNINNCNQQGNVHPYLNNNNNNNNNNNSTVLTPIWDKSGDNKQLCGGQRHLIKNSTRNLSCPAPSVDTVEHFPLKCDFLSPISPDSYRQ